MAHRTGKERESSKEGGRMAKSLASTRKLGGSAERSGMRNAHHSSWQWAI
ncbi:hypothetical protein TRIUR3_15832 [Triticum urartu]|uniref:Uncharacterized protein n=1 Tax=Triticum urartu TaxID=4572 RepID=M7ZN81_TRIUA|nr:hypothetical protein TRIUR3_15832 [Triticum urartu]